MVTFEGSASASAGAPMMRALLCLRLSRRGSQRLGIANGGPPCGTRTYERCHSSPPSAVTTLAFVLVAVCFYFW